jgi:hypothetical protein
MVNSASDGITVHVALDTFRPREAARLAVGITKIDGVIVGAVVIDQSAVHFAGRWNAEFALHARIGAVGVRIVGCCLGVS